MDNRERQDRGRIRCRDQPYSRSFPHRQRSLSLHCLHPLLHSHHSFMAAIDIVDYYLGALLPSPESVRIDVPSISLPTLTKLGLLPFLRHSYGKSFLFCDALKTIPGHPQSSLLSQLRLVSLLSQHGFSETSISMLFRHHTHSTAFTFVVDNFFSVHALPCGPRIAEEKESGFPVPSRFKSAGAGEYTGEAEEMRE
jgi:hypothetical protein